MHSRATPRLTPNWAAMSASRGSHEPAATRPATMSPMSTRITFSCSRDMR